MFPIQWYGNEGDVGRSCKDKFMLRHKATRIYASFKVEALMTNEFE